jgi:hypothetical protein
MEAATAAPEEDQDVGEDRRRRVAIPAEPPFTGGADGADRAGRTPPAGGRAGARVPSGRRGDPRLGGRVPGAGWLGLHLVLLGAGQREG